MFDCSCSYKIFVTAIITSYALGIVWLSVNDVVSVAIEIAAIKAAAVLHTVFGLGVVNGH